LKRRTDIEARLDRSLHGQVRTPKLDRRFDTAVWARIEGEEARAMEAVVARRPSRATRASRWLAISNLVGIAVTLVFVAYFLMRTFGGIPAPTLELDVNLPVPVIPEEAAMQLVAVLGQMLGVVALLFGLSFTSLGRRVRSAFG
jgi:putative exporter of polyketide antibiotics